MIQYAAIAGIVALFFPKQTKAGLISASDVVGKVFGPFMSIGPQPKNIIESTALQIAREKLVVSEGYRNKAYLDTRGYLTVGIGHLVLPIDNIRLGDVISDARIEQFFTQDVGKAFNAAKTQALDLKKYESHFIAALTEVNFQLGTGWTKTFKNTYAYLKSGNSKQAISNLLSSDWNKQTPVRVANFIREINRAYNYGGTA